MQPNLEDVKAWARGAGEILRSGYGKQHNINKKGRIDLVTEMDRFSEAYLLEKIGAAFPQDGIYAEESGQSDGTSEGCWYIDPLDGTTNYAHHIPIFSVSIAYAIGGELALGVVYDPMRGECFSAERGKGAWLDGERIAVSDTDELISSLVVTGFPYDIHVSEKNLASFAHFTRLTQGVRRLGSAALDLCYVASGRFDGYWEQTLRPYDLAAGALIAREAGGVVTSMGGSQDLLQPPFSILAGNPSIHPLMLKEFQGIL